MPIDPGTLNRRVTIRRYTVVHDPQWGDTYEWTDLRTVWGAVKVDSADEQFAADQLYAERVVTITIRFTRDLTEVDRLSCDGIEYDILGLIEIGNRDGLEVKAKATDPSAQS